MPKLLEFHTFAEKKPEHGQEIFYFHVRRFYNSVVPYFATIYHTWVEYDKDGKVTGISYCYNKGDTPPDNCRIEIGCDEGWHINDTDLWCPFESVDDMVNE